MHKIKRNMDTPESRAFWEHAEKVAAEVKSWPACKQASINCSDVRTPQERSSYINSLMCPGCGGYKYPDQDFCEKCFKKEPKCPDR